MSEETNTQERSTLGMSDEEFLSMDPTQFEGSMETVSEESEETFDDQDDQSDLDNEDHEESEETEDSEETEATESEESEDEEEDSDETFEEQEETSEDNESEDPAESGETSDQGSTEETSVDYKAQYERILAPFRANGKEMQVKSINEAISLMQMGANYNKKMAALKPSLKILKMLENHQLLDEGKLSFLMDLDKKNPEAIRKLVKDSGIDLFDLDQEGENEYKPNTYTVHDNELELDAVLDELQDTPTYSKTLDVVSNKWDNASKGIIAKNPQLLKAINEHVANGIYDRISKEVERERMLGRLQGVSDLDAYKQIGDVLDARGEFNHLVQQPNQRTQPVAQKKLAPKGRKEDSKLKSKRRAASPTKTATATPTDNDFNPLAMSDDEFSKLIHEQLL